MAIEPNKLPADYGRDHEGAGCWCLESDVSSYECVRAAHVPCRWCNDEGVVHDMAGDIIGPCDCGPVQA